MEPSYLPWNGDFLRWIEQCAVEAWLCIWWTCVNSKQYNAVGLFLFGYLWQLIFKSKSFLVWAVGVSSGHSLRMLPFGNCSLCLRVEQVTSFSQADVVPVSLVTKCEPPLVGSRRVRFEFVSYTSVFWTLVHHPVVVVCRVWTIRIWGLPGGRRSLARGLRGTALASSHVTGPLYCEEPLLRVPVAMMDEEGPFKLFLSWTLNVKITNLEVKNLYPLAGLTDLGYSAVVSWMDKRDTQPAAGVNTHTSALRQLCGDYPDLSVSACVSSAPLHSWSETSA